MITLLYISTYSFSWFSFIRERCLCEQWLEKFSIETHCRTSTEHESLRWTLRNSWVCIGASSNACTMFVLVVWIHIIAYKHLFILMFGYKTWYVNQPILLFLSSYFFIHSFFLQILFINLWKRKIKIVKIIIISLNWKW